MRKRKRDRQADERSGQKKPRTLEKKRGHKRPRHETEIEPKKEETASETEKRDKCVEMLGGV